MSIFEGLLKTGFTVFILQDIQYADIDHMDERNDFTIDPVNFAGLSDYFKELQAGGMHTIIILVNYHSLKI